MAFHDALVIASTLYTMTTVASFPHAAWKFSVTMRIRHTPLTSKHALVRGYSRQPITMMPEGPEVRTLVDQLQPAVGMRLVDFRFLSGRYVRHGRPAGFEAFARTMTPLDAARDREMTARIHPGAGGNNNNGGEDNFGHDSTANPNDEKDGDRQNEAIDVITSLKCKGKFIYLTLDRGRIKSDQHANLTTEDYQRSIWITLGMTGRFVNEDQVNESTTYSNDEASKPRWYMELMDLTNRRRRRIYYRDARNFGTLHFVLSTTELNDKLGSLGADLLDVDTTEDVFLDVMNKSIQGRNICKFLMDQGKIAGIGNYILAEALYRARIDPFADLQEINLNQRKHLFQQLREVAFSSYAAQGLTRPNGDTYRNLNGYRGEFEFQLQCYGQSTSPNGNPVVKEVNGPHGRTIWFVAEEQLFMSPSQRFQYNIRAVDSVLVESQTRRDSASKQSLPNSFARNLASQLSENSWKNVLASYMDSESFQSLANSIQSDITRGATVYPPVTDIFAALNLCPLNKIKCVIVGQDPYHQPRQSRGLAFSVRKGVAIPPSLKNIFKEAMDDVGIEPPHHGDLECWARQGVLLLNTVLTVRRGEANSHAKLGWEGFTDFIIQTINDQANSVVFLLWGAPAAKKASCVDESRHTVIKTSHPSPLGATKTNSPFLGSRCFSRANDALVASGKEPIDWRVP